MGSKPHITQPPTPRHQPSKTKMVVYYQIAGQEVGSHMLSIGVLSTLFGGIWAMSGGSKKSAGPNNTPPLNASSKYEENFIQEFLKQADGGSGNREGGKS